MGMRLGLLHRSVAITVLMGFAAWAPSISALTFKVGTGPNCTQSSVEDAVTASEGSAGPDTIRVTRSALYEVQAISFDVTQEVTITGGFANCTTNVEDDDKTVLNGIQGPHAPVMTINGAIGSKVHLRKLFITGGDVSANSLAGGGIYYTGKGLLDIADSLISGNTGAYGGGINAGGTDDAAELDIGPNTRLVDNTALYNGGGLYSNNITTLILGDDISISQNRATGATSGWGGGILIRACDKNSTVYLGSPGSLDSPVVYDNTARYGGGVFVEGAQGCSSSGDAELRMFSIHANQHSEIVDNKATVAGGGVYTSPHNGTQNSADVYFYNASIIGNRAPTGSALHLGADGSGNQGRAYFNQAGAPAGAIPCFAGYSCGEIRGNISSNGQVIGGESNNYLLLQKMSVTGNQGIELIRLNELQSYNNLFAGNITSGRLIETHDLTAKESTIAGNIIDGSEVIGINTGGDPKILRSIIWQASRPALHNDGLTPTIQDVISNDFTGVTGGSSFHMVVADPRFVDPENGDYFPTTASPAVDFAAPVNFYPDDLLSSPRAVDLDIVPNRYGPRDIGAFERQAVQPLVLNSTFDANVDTWPEVTVGASTWDGTQNAPGTPAGGALHVVVSGTSLSARKQCIHLPGPGTYSLNGWGKAPTGNFGQIISYVSLGWEYRKAGNESCGGTVTLSGNLPLSHDNTWRKPTTPATIVVPAVNGWTRDSSILVYLVIEDGPGSGSPPDAPTSNLNGWFDAITLDVVGDSIFANGFD